MEDEDPKEDLEEDFEVSEVQLIGSKDLKGNLSECKTEQIEGENPGGDHKEERREFIMQTNQTGELETWELR